MPRPFMRLYLPLYLLSLALLSLAALPQTAPGYMDTDYYQMGAVNLEVGRGFNEMIAWNYLNDPAGLPQPSHAYWPPLASLLAAAGLRLFGAGRVGLILLGAAAAPLSAALALRWHGQARAGWLAGGLGLVPGFYLAYLPTTDTFGLYMLGGTAFILVSGRLFDGDHPLNRRGAAGVSLVLGALAGWMHLARADGPVWLAAGLAAALSAVPRRPVALGGRLAITLAGYLLVMGPWLARNLLVYGAPLAPGGSLALWFIRYDDLYAYPASLITPERWLASGWGAILAARAEALALNVQTLLAVQGGVVWLPLAAAGLWRLRQRPEIRLALLAWGLTLTVMTLAFPFAGGRGGYFHSGAAFQPLIWAAVPGGLAAFVEWGCRRRGWRFDRAWGMFGAALLAASLALTAVAYIGRVFGAQPGRIAWNASQEDYKAVEAWLAGSEAAPGAPVLVNNPPGYFLASGRPALAIPDGPPETALAAARRYRAVYLILEANHPDELKNLYETRRPPAGLDYLAEVDGLQVYRIR